MELEEISTSSFKVLRPSRVLEFIHFDMTCMVNKIKQ